MAEPLKNQFGIEVAEQLAEALWQQDRSFPRKSFVKVCQQGYEALELMPRGMQIARTLKKFLPEDYPTAVSLLMASLGPKLTRTENNGMAPFFYLPHSMFIAEYGLAYFEESMRAQYELTQRFTAEYSIRPFLDAYPQQSLKYLRKWLEDESVHVRRLVSEGTRPRLPWAPRLKTFPFATPEVLALLEALKDDPALYVRRSVANHLNDIGKTEPGLLCELMRDWQQAADAQRQWVVKHALRSLIKQGYPEAFAVLGYSTRVELELAELLLHPATVSLGETLNVAIQVRNKTRQPQQAIIDLRVFFLKANGKSSPKTFKLKNVELSAGETLPLSKGISFREMTTRKHYPGWHRLAVLINGNVCEEREFLVSE